jgi:hypothetical protein
MKVVSLASVRGAPGVTTTSILLASTFDRWVVVEADLDGGVLAVRYGLGREPGLTTLRSRCRPILTRGEHTRKMPVASRSWSDPTLQVRARSLWRTAGERITQAVAAEGTRWSMPAGSAHRCRSWPHPISC